ncbi:MAG: hypothetical protein JWO68_3033 [Actinomycetia bacterium]|nr:hypothetical protein [Actinomycetes bacterium]
MSGIDLVVRRRENGDVTEAWWATAARVCAQEVRRLVENGLTPTGEGMSAEEFPVDLADIDRMHQAGGLPELNRGDEVLSFDI